MGVPVNKLICASNANNVLTDFLKTGIYDRNRAFHATISPSMDILISSNLERLLYMLSGENDKLINEWFGKLASEGRYEVSDDVKKILFEEFSAGCCTDDETKATIKEIYDRYSYTCDTHTAVAVKVYEDYKAATGDTTKTVIASTASPYKFSGSVLSAIGVNTDASEFDLVEKLAETSKLAVPQSLAALKDKEIRFSEVIDKTEMKSYVFRTLGI
jgi:threonine synthase